MAEASHPSGVSPNSRSSPCLLPLVGGQLRDGGLPLPAVLCCPLAPLPEPWDRGDVCLCRDVQGGLSPVLPGGRSAVMGRELQEFSLHLAELFR